MTQRAFRPAVDRIPLGLTLCRAALAPVVAWLAGVRPSPWGFGACLVVAFLSDIFDGVIARRLDIATPFLRRLDSAVDTLFYGACLLAAWHLHPRSISDRYPSLALLLALELLRYAFDLRKFGREASYHMWSSKLWGLALFVGFFGLLVFGATGAAVSIAVWLGIVADLEGLAISCTLDRWQADVPTWLHARRLRAGRAAAAPQT
jgi:phosphatidylglycerophosphate synthase